MEVIDGNRIAAELIAELKVEVSGITGRKPCIALVRVGDDPASVSYVKKKGQTASEIGIESRVLLPPADISQAGLEQLVESLNGDAKVDGILVQAPLPPQLDERAIFAKISPGKDVDGLNPVSLGKVAQDDDSGFTPCTPAGIMEILSRCGVSLEGRHLVVVGRSLLVGKPAALLGLQRRAGANATVTVCHSKTPDLPAMTRQADVLVAALGRPEFITASMVKPGVVVIDVGINRVPDPSRKAGYRLVGDVHFESVAPMASKITPVPGGVGPMTVAMLMKNTVKAHRQRAT
jgi:methylenetetrahydrofolate dehydrogenase (NADP+)/methenyltetrahydrofolate cyclohydrolase